MHDTGANNPYLKRWVQPDDGRLGPNPNNNSHNKPGGTVCANAYIGKLQDGTVAIYQALPWDMRCWLSGQGPNGNANRMGFIGYEICRDNMESREYFLDAVMDKAVMLTAYLCQMMGVEPWTIVKETTSGPVYSVTDHTGLHAVGCASNHSDIGEWLKKFGYTFEDFRRAVEDAMEDTIVPEYIDDGDENVNKLNLPTLARGAEGNNVVLLQSLLIAHGASVGRSGADGKFGANTENAVIQFQEWAGLAITGICGADTWSALMEQNGGGDDVSVNPGFVQIEKTKLLEIYESAKAIETISANALNE